METGVAGVIEHGIVVGAEDPVSGIVHWHSGECTELASNDVLREMVEIYSKMLVSEASKSCDILKSLYWARKVSFSAYFKSGTPLTS